MQEVPVLMVTQNPALWQSWQLLAPLGWHPYRGVSFKDVQHWQASGHSLVVLDVELLSTQTEVWDRCLAALCVLVLSARMSDAEGQMVLTRGCNGYAHTHLDAVSLSRILTSMQEGATWVGRSLLQKLLQGIDQRLPPESSSDWSAALSQRETEVARHAAHGLCNADIARQLSITERTVRAHLSAVFEKLQLQDRLQLVLKVHGIRA